MSIAIVKYVDEEGVNNAVIDNPWGGTTHITAESPSALDMAIERERSFIESLVNTPSRIAERVVELEVESSFEADCLMDCLD